MLISLHMPKTAGSSFLAGLQQHYRDTLIIDYGDRPINHNAALRNSHAIAAALRHGLRPGKFREIACIHGHFMPLKYRLLGWRVPLQFITWLREPVERLGSHYHYWKRHYNPRDAGILHRRVVEEQWSLERFCLGPELQNTYCKFLWGLPLEQFEFVGITEHYEEDLTYFSHHILGEALDSRRDNVNTQSGPSGYIEDPVLRAEIEQHHARDMALYRRALAQRALRPV